MLDGHQPLQRGVAVIDGDKEAVLWLFKVVVNMDKEAPAADREAAEEGIRNFIGMPECEVNLGCERTGEKRERERFNFFTIDHRDLGDRSKT